ncbi:hypothetical protein EMIT0P201_80057 [Pseudomonas chlororaphis]
MPALLCVCRRFGDLPLRSLCMPTRYRDADSGHYITEQDAKKNPKQSVKETDKPKPKPKPKSPSKSKGK